MRFKEQKPTAIVKPLTMKLPIRLLGCTAVAALLFAACQQNQHAASTQAATATKTTETKPAKPDTAATASAPTNDEEQVVKLIMDLQEIKMRNAEVERLSKGKRRLSTYVESPPSSDDPNYTVKVAEDNGSNFVTYYTFAVDGKTRAIKYYDVVQDTLISLNDWRKTTPLKDR